MPCCKDMAVPMPLVSDRSPHDVVEEEGQAHMRGNTVADAPQKMHSFRNIYFENRRQNKHSVL
jgi:hypothetical protein